MAPLPLSPLTELDAVNEILLSIGEAPVNTLDVAGIRDVSIARSRLHGASRNVQTRGWSWNKDEGYVLSPDVNNHVLIADNVLHVDPCDDRLDFVVRRDPNDQTMKLWDRENNTFEITEPVEVDIIWFHAFEDIPQAARNYIAVRAGRLFQTQIIGARILFEFTALHEREAYALLRAVEARSKDRNFFRAPTAANRIVHRR